MRLWHENLISKLPRQQLLGQHRECCALRGLGWGKNHATVNYVFDHSPCKLYKYHVRVMREMQRRGYRNDPLWEDPAYRGKSCLPFSELHSYGENENCPIYPEHDEIYLEECLENLARKDIFLRSNPNSK